MAVDREQLQNILKKANQPARQQAKQSGAPFIVQNSCCENSRHNSIRH